MKTHSFSVYKGNCLAYAGGFLTTGSNADIAEFTFDSSYADAPVRKAYFKVGDAVPYSILLLDGRCTIPVYVEPCTLLVGVQCLSADGTEVHPTVYVEVEVLQGAVGDGINPPPVTPDEAAQLMNIKADGVVVDGAVIQLTANSQRIGQPVTIDAVVGPAGPQGLPGEQGLPGADGYTPVKGVDYFDGTNGTNGVDGYTPVKGVDYFDGAPGEKGDTGATGSPGTNGVGVPVGGTAGQVLSKIDGTNYNTEWKNPSGGVTDLLKARVYALFGGNTPTTLTESQYISDLSNASNYGYALFENSSVICGWVRYYPEGSYYTRWKKIGIICDKTTNSYLMYDIGNNLTTYAPSFITYTIVRCAEGFGYDSNGSMMYLRNDFIYTDSSMTVTQAVCKALGNMYSGYIPSAVFTAITKKALTERK